MMISWLQTLARGEMPVVHILWRVVPVFVLLNLLFLRIMGGALILEQHFLPGTGLIAFFAAFFLGIFGIALGACTVLLSAAACRISRRQSYSGRKKSLRKCLIGIIAVANIWVFAESLVALDLILSIFGKIWTA